MTTEESKQPFSEVMFEYHSREFDFEDSLYEARGSHFFDFNNLSGDHYDNSLEIFEVNEDGRLNPAMQKIIYDAGFSMCYVNHVDGWETQYHWDQSVPFIPSKGWRRKKGIEEEGYLINYLPDGWKNTNIKYTVVTDPFENVSLEDGK